MTATTMNVDVLCVGHASYDLVFSVPSHPSEDEKIVAESLIGCGGGPAANAAVTVSRLGLQSAFAGYLGQDIFGAKHFQELTEDKVDTRLIIRSNSPTPLSTILVKPDGKRALINYKGETSPLPSGAIDFSSVSAKVILFDGHEPHISVPLMEKANKDCIPTVLDAGSLHEGTLALMDKVNFLVCSEKFALQYAGNIETALSRMAKVSPAVIITLGDKGLLWQRGTERKALPAPVIKVKDTTGAGDAFHGAFAAAVASGMTWPEMLRFSSAAGAFCCTRTGARPGLPCDKELRSLLDRY